MFVSSSEVLYKQLFLAPKEQHKRLDIALGKVLIDIVLIFQMVQNGTYRNLRINKCIFAVFVGLNINMTSRSAFSLITCV